MSTRYSGLARADLVLGVLAAARTPADPGSLSAPSAFAQRCDHLRRAPHDVDRCLRQVSVGHLPGLELRDVDLGGQRPARERARTAPRTRRTAPRRTRRRPRRWPPSPTVRNLRRLHDVDLFVRIDELPPSSGSPATGSRPALPGSGARSKRTGMQFPHRRGAAHYTQTKLAPRARRIFAQMTREKLGVGVSLFVAGSIVGGLALAFLLVAWRPELVRPRQPPRARPAAGRARGAGAARRQLRRCRAARGACRGEHLHRAARHRARRPLHAG